MKDIRRYLFAGLGVWLPILVTFMVVRFIVEILDTTIAFLPKNYQPTHVLGFYIPGFGILFSLAVLFVTGMVATNFFGQQLFIWGEKLLSKIPFVSSIYTATKQVIQTLFSSKSDAFRKVLIIEYPKPGIYSLAFMTSNEFFHPTLENGSLITVFVPTTPNPTSGFLLMIPKENVQESPMSVEEALKFIISLGVMKPIPNANSNLSITPNETIKINEDL